MPQICRQEFRPAQGSRPAHRSPRQSGRSATSPSVRQKLLARHDVVLLDTCGEGTEVTDLMACARRGKQSCFVIVQWRGDRLLHAEVFFTEEEARKVFAQGCLYELTRFALPTIILAGL